MQAQMASMLQAAHRQQTQPGTQPLAPGAGPFGGAAASGVASAPQTGTAASWRLENTPAVLLRGLSTEFLADLSFPGQ